MEQKFQRSQKIPSPRNPLTHNPLHIIHFLIGNFPHKTLYTNDLHTTTSFIKNTPTPNNTPPTLELTYNIIMNDTIKTIDNEVIKINDNWKDVTNLPYDERWTNCPTLIDEHEHLWVDLSVLD